MSGIMAVTKSTKIPLPLSTQGTLEESSKENFIDDLHTIQLSTTTITKYKCLERYLKKRKQAVNRRTAKKHATANSVHQRPSSARNARRKNNDITCLEKQLHEMQSAIMSLYCRRRFVEKMVEDFHVMFSLSCCCNFSEWLKMFLKNQKTISDSILRNVDAICNDQNSYFSKDAFHKWQKQFEKKRTEILTPIVKDLKYIQIKMNVLTELKYTSSEQFKQAHAVLEYLKQLSDLITHLKDNTHDDEVLKKISILIDFFLRWTMSMNCDIPFVTEISLALNHFMYTPCSYKNVRVLAKHCDGLPLVSVGSGSGMLELFLINCGINVTTIEQLPDECKSIHCSNPGRMQDFDFKEPCVLFFGFPARFDHDGAIAPSGKCNLCQVLYNCVLEGCFTKLVVTYDDTVNDFLSGENNDESLINVGTGPFWNLVRNFFTRGKHGPASSFFSEKYMTLFTLSPHNALKMLDQGVKDGYVESPSLLHVIVSSVLDQEQQSLSKLRQALRMKQIKEYVHVRVLERWDRDYFYMLPLSEMFSTDFDFPELWSCDGRFYQEDIVKKEKKVSKIRLKRKCLEKEFMLSHEKMTRVCTDLLKKYF
jgi:hypothetical protein